MKRRILLICGVEKTRLHEKKALGRFRFDGIHLDSFVGVFIFSALLADSLCVAVFEWNGNFGIRIGFRVEHLVKWLNLLDPNETNRFYFFSPIYRINIYKNINKSNKTINKIIKTINIYNKFRVSPLKCHVERLMQSQEAVWQHTHSLYKHAVKSIRKSIQRRQLCLLSSRGSVRKDGRLVKHSSIKIIIKQLTLKIVKIKTKSNI